MPSSNPPVYLLKGHSSFPVDGNFKSKEKQSCRREGKFDPHPLPMSYHPMIPAAAESSSSMMRTILAMHSEKFLLACTPPFHAWLETDGKWWFDGSSDRFSHVASLSATFLAARVLAPIAVLHQILSHAASSVGRILWNACSHNALWF